MTGPQRQPSCYAQIEIYFVICDNCYAGPNPWHVSFSYARALQNTVLKTWQGEESNWKAAQDALAKRAAANSAAQKGEYDPSKEGSEAGEGMYQKGYTY